MCACVLPKANTCQARSFQVGVGFGQLSFFFGVQPEKPTNSFAELLLVPPHLKTTITWAVSDRRFVCRVAWPLLLGVLPLHELDDLPGAKVWDEFLPKKVLGRLSCLFLIYSGVPPPKHVCTWDELVLYAVSIPQKSGCVFRAKPFFFFFFFAGLNSHNRVFLL